MVEELTHQVDTEFTCLINEEFRFASGTGCDRGAPGLQDAYGHIGSRILRSDEIEVEIGVVRKGLQRPSCDEPDSIIGVPEGLAEVGYHPAGAGGGLGWFPAHGMGGYSAETSVAA